MKRAWLWAESDTHGGHRQGLMNPDTMLPEDDDLEKWYKPGITKTQKFLWWLRTGIIRRVRVLIGEDPLYYFHLGDPTQGHKYKSEWVSTRMSDQVIIARGNMEPVFNIPNLKACRFLMGTASHEFGEGSSPVLLDQLYRREFPNLNIRTIRHGRAQINRMVVDYAHHGPGPGIREWTRGNVARLYLRHRMMKKIMGRREPADLYLRGHYHHFVNVSDSIHTEDDRYYDARLVVLPSMCGIGCHAVQATKSVDSVTYGSVLFEIVNGKILEIHKLFMTKALPVCEVL